MECYNPAKALKCRIVATVDGKEVVSKLVTPYTPAPVNGGCGLVWVWSVWVSSLMYSYSCYCYATASRGYSITSTTWCWDQQQWVYWWMLCYMFLLYSWYRSLSVQHQCVATPPPDDSAHSSLHTYSNCRLILEQSNYFMFQLLIILCSIIAPKTNILQCGKCAVKKMRVSVTRSFPTSLCDTVCIALTTVF